MGMHIDNNRPTCGNGWSFTRDSSTTSQDILQEEQAALQADVDYMHDNYEGCDWCCGGGDEWMAECQERLAEIAALLKGSDR